MLGPDPKLTEGERIALITALGIAAAGIIPALINIASEAIKARREPAKSEEAKADA